MKIIGFAVLSCLWLSHCAFGQDQISQAPNSSLFGMQPDNIGVATNSVNLFTGDLNLPMTLVSLPGRNGLDVDVSISYSSTGVTKSVSTWNLESPTGVVGLGWDFDIPRIVADNKQTGTRHDDVYYIVDGGSSNQLIRTLSGTDNGGPYFEYQTSKYKFWKIKFYYDAAEISGSGSGPNKWEITKEDGSKFIYGDKNSGRKTIQYVVCWGNWIGSSIVTAGQSKLANSWNLSEIVGVWGEKVTFEYENVEQYVGSTSGQMHTEASYLKEIKDALGRKVQFVYAEKQSQYYAEPHTELINEPDAYQEFYEKKYLDHIDVRDEAGNVFQTIQLGYGSINNGTTQAKMLLTSITQKNAALNSLPAIKFSYFSDTNLKGLLQAVTYPSGGTVVYDYSVKTIHRSARDFEIVAPAGFAEPKVSLGDDFAVVTWRKMGSGNTHSSAPQEVKLYIYQWVGEWKEVMMQTISNVSLTYDRNHPGRHMEYVDFIVNTGKDFCVVAKKNTGTTWSCYFFHDDPSKRNLWKSLSRSIDVINGTPAVFIGDDFVGIGSEMYDVRMFTYNGNDWNESDITQTEPGVSRYYGGINNYFIAQREICLLCPPSGSSFIDFNYLTEDKQWLSKNLDVSLQYMSDDKSLWYPSNSMAFVMAQSNAERVYRWDINYNTFFKDDKDVNNVDLFGSLDHGLKLSFLNNSFIATADGGLSRFDGSGWRKTDINCISSDMFDYTYSFGDDYAIRPVSLTGNNYNGARKVFNPNTLTWEADVLMDGVNGGAAFGNAGIDYYYYGNGYYYRSTNGTWAKKNTYAETKYSYGGFPRFELRAGVYPNNSIDVVNFKNGEFVTSTINGYNYLQHPRPSTMLGSIGEAANTFVLTEFILDQDDFAGWTFASKLKIFRIVDDSYAGKQTDIVVSSISMTTADKVEFSAIQYNGQTATMDQSGLSANYNEVTVIPGISNPAQLARPNGYTKTFFYNGLSEAELFTSLPTILDYRWIGVPYEVKAFDANGNAVSSTKTTHATKFKDLYNVNSVKVGRGFYLEAYKVEQTIDGILTTTTTTFDSNTGLPISVATSGPVSTIVGYRYMWEFYDPLRNRNMLTPVAIVKSTINGQVFGAKTTRYKTWNSTSSPDGIIAAFDEYEWSHNGNSDFTAWDANSIPSNDWIFDGQVTFRDPSSGTPIEIFSGDNAAKSILLNMNKTYTVAIANACLKDIAYLSFEDDDLGNFNQRNGVRVLENAKTGSQCFLLSNIQKDNLNPKEVYTVSFWAKSNGGSVNISSAGVVPISNLSDWTYFEYTLTGLSSIALQKTGTIDVKIDELRVHPKKSSMNTSVFHPIYGLQSAMDANNMLIKYEFDEWGKIKNELDDKGNIIKSYFYNYKN